MGFQSQKKCSKTYYRFLDVSACIKILVQHFEFKVQSPEPRNYGFLS